MTRGWRQTARGTLACLLGLMSVGVAAWGRPGTVTTKDGSTFQGDVTERGNAVIIKRGNEPPVTMNKGNVASIEYSASAADQFKEQLAKLGKKDVAGRIALARTAIDQGEFDLALDALDSAVAIDPNNEEALQMRRAVLKQRQLARRSGGKPGPAPREETMPPDEAPAGSGERPARPRERRGSDGGTTRRTGPIRQVTPEEINRIRQLELQPGERVQVRFEDDVRRKYQGSSEFTPQQFAALTPQEQAMEILKNGSSRLHEDVIIATDPASIAQFKSLVQRNVLTGCAASSCHGSSNRAGDFFLHNPAGKEADLYTNFLLMQGYTKTIDGRELSMIDRTRPENSLLLLYGLPTESSDVPHPKAQNFRPLYRGKSDPKYKQTVEWLGKTLAAVAPDYGIDLTSEPDGAGGSTTRPARGNRRPPREDDSR